MTRWFRFYDDAMHDAKLLRLSDATFRAWMTLLCVASKNDGALPPAEDIALTLRCKKPLVAGWITELVAAGLLDRTETGFVPHNWGDRQYKSDSSAERMKRHRDGKRDVTPTVTSDVTVTVQNRADTDTDTEQKEEPREVALSSGPSDFDIFWQEWPNKVGKPAAMKAIRSALKRASFNDIMAGLRDYIRDKPPDRPWLNPATFLNQNRWEDQPAQVSNGRIEKAESLSHVARRLAESGVAFGDRPAAPSLRSIEGGADVRLLPQGGSERSGDLCGGDGGGIKRISQGGD